MRSGRGALPFNDNFLNVSLLTGENFEIVAQRDFPVMGSTAGSGNLVINCAPKKSLKFNACGGHKKNGSSRKRKA